MYKRKFKNGLQTYESMSNSLIIKEMQMKQIQDNISNLLTQIKKLLVLCFGNSQGNQTLPCIADVSLNWYILSKMSDRERQILYNLTYMWNFKNWTNRNRGQFGGYQRKKRGGEWGGGESEWRWSKGTISYKCWECNVRCGYYK